jgi:hypothetical protein
MSAPAARICGMPRLAPYDKKALADLLRRQDGLVGRPQTADCGMTNSAVRHRIRPDGPWQVVLPGVYLCNGGVMSGSQRDMAAFLYAGKYGRDALAVTGPAALAWHGIRASPAEHVDVLVRSQCRRRDVGFARLHPTAVTPAVAFRDGALVYAPEPRAIADTVRQLGGSAEIRAVVAAGVQQGKVEIWQLAEELKHGSSWRSARLRAALPRLPTGSGRQRRPIL